MMTMMGCYERPADRAQHTIRYEALDGAEQTLSVSPGATCFASTYAGDPSHCTWGVERRAEISGLGPLAGCFLALGFGLGLVGTASARR